MSPVVLPSPVPFASSGSLLTMVAVAVSIELGSHASVALKPRLMATYLWLGGQQYIGDAMLPVDDYVSRTVMTVLSTPRPPKSSVTMSCTLCTPTGRVT